MTTETSPVVLITGASSGIGQATAVKFAEQGWNVVATMRNPTDGKALQNRHHSIKVQPLDVTDPVTVEAAVAETLRQFGRIDALINNAGYGLFGPFETAGDDQIRRQFATNVDGVFALTRAVLPTMRNQRSGSIINVASLGGIIPLPFFSLYNATKFAVVGFTEALSYELAPFGIRAKTIAPGGVATDFAGRSMERTFESGESPYSETLTKALTAMSQRRGNYSTPESVAEVIYTAATDGTGKVMYLAGPDAEQGFEMNRSLSEAKRLEMVRQHAGL
ncbi:SDR family oxidoreductase [Hahella aquimaris]|uniref:SDR family oxidoreductase n=1 Tax=Hahella sp. HNIBRBA332 TaxID=3015983 RepID=UPI00273BD75F|nr:SDR family oxidoreductase [Hahella sp. HNIBRBA332]WLQ16354.1 SDR family oxidoreductase [Hahella sp. HNIBRBA332]